MQENLETDDIIINTKRNLIPSQCENTGKINPPLIRVCRGCGISLTYIRKNSFVRAEKGNRVCHTCSNKTDEHRKNLSISLTGIKRSEEFKENARQKMKLRPITWGDKISKSLKGRHHSPEIIQKLIDNHVGMTGRKHTINTIDKMRSIKIGSNNPMYGRVISSDTRKKHRVSMLNYIKTYRGNIQCNVGKNENKILNNIEKSTGTKIERGVEIKELGYIVDGYDPDLKVVYEVYEKYHRRPEQKAKDDIRQQEIIKHLNCKFNIIWDL